MAKFKCKCGEFTVARTTIKVIDNKVVYPESYCNTCKIYADSVREGKGFGGIIKKAGGTVSKKF
jgi:hypothetical protein